MERDVPSPYNRVPEQTDSFAQFYVILHTYGEWPTPKALIMDQHLFVRSQIKKTIPLVHPEGYLGGFRVKSKPRAAAI